jgi:uncharacterized membrane protein
MTGSAFDARTESATTSSVERRTAAPNAATLVLWVVLVILVSLGATAVVLRWRFPDDLTIQLEGLRQAILAVVYDNPSTSPARLAEAAQFDARFRDHRAITLWHITAGGAFLVLTPLQLLSPIRTRYPALHRWTGRTLIVLSVIAGITGLIFGIGMPFGGPAEAVVIALVAAWLFTSLARGYRAIRRGDTARHREWMLRVVGACIGVSVVRVVGATVDVALTPNGLGATDAFLIALWLGWSVTFAVTEWWIRRTRPDYQ